MRHRPGSSRRRAALLSGLTKRAAELICRGRPVSAARRLAGRVVITDGRTYHWTNGELTADRRRQQPQECGELTAEQSRHTTETELKGETEPAIPSCRELRGGLEAWGVVRLSN